MDDETDDFLSSLDRRIQLGIANFSDRLNYRLIAADGGVPAAKGAGQEKRAKELSRVAIVSLLFNWPSTGGGIVHTAELAKFLTKAGYDVCHFFARNASWQIGNLHDPMSYNYEVINFEDQEWNARTITEKFKIAVTAFSPDFVVVTDSWNAKLLLVEAVEEFPYFIRLAALECLCPQNNVRLLVDENGVAMQCELNQLACRDACLQCVKMRPQASGGLHRAERQLAEFESPSYSARLLRAFENAKSVLVVNHQIASLVKPFVQDVRVIPSGFDRERFRGLPSRQPNELPFRILFAGLVEEYMKGFQVLLAACIQMWEIRQDFELWVTADYLQSQPQFVKFCGWQDQRALPHLMAQCDVVVVPTVAQEALGRTAVEAMAVGRAVIASRLGGLVETVTEGVTGLLVRPSDPAELMTALCLLMDDRELTASLGHNGRCRFSNLYPWEKIIEDHYRPLFHLSK